MGLVTGLLSIIGSFFAASLLIWHALFAAFTGEISFYAPVAQQTIQQAPVLSQNNATSTATSSLSVKNKIQIAPKKPMVIAITKPAAPKLPVLVPPVSIPLLPTEQVDQTARAALVNIFCTTQAGGYLHPISGSGVIIDTRGVILTNAHVGQFFLLRDFPTTGNVDCVVRTGSPAAPMYRASLLYLPPAWINANASQIVSNIPMGTGENDYAFLLITGSINPTTPLPGVFPALQMTSADPDTGDQTVLAAYPAGFLDGSTITSDLFITSAVATVQTLYTFNDPTHVDVFSIGGTVVSQSGSSGGAVVRLTDGKLQGLISTDTASSTTAGRDLRAITLGYINRSLQAAGQGGVVALLSQDLLKAAVLFNTTVAPVEEQKLIDVLKK
jgi:hypothetical protein